MNKFSHQIILKTTRTQRITSERKNLTLFAIHFPIVCIFGNSQWFNLFRRAFGKKKISTAFSFSDNFSEIQNIVPNVRSTLVLELESNVQWLLCKWWFWRINMTIYVDKVGFPVNKKYLIKRNRVALLFKCFDSESLVICTQCHWVKLKFSDVFERELYFRNDWEKMIDLDRILDASTFLFRIFNLFLKTDFLLIELIQCLRKFLIFCFQRIYNEGIWVVSTDVSMIDVWPLVSYEIESLMIFFAMQWWF